VKRCLEMYLLALGVCGLSLGYVAWPGTAWGGALSILLPFMCGLQPTRLRALAISAGYYLGALSPYAISELLVTQGIDGWERLVTTSLVLAFSSAVWSLNGGHHPTAFRPFITLLGVWFVTLITPMGGWGLAHPGLGWLFIGKGGMGALTFVVAGVLTSLLVTAIRREREQQAPVSVISGRSLAFAICTTVILGGTFDQTAAPSHAGPVAAMPTNRSQVELQRSDIQRNQAMRLDALLGKLALVNLQYEPILLVFTPQWHFGVRLSTEREAVLKELRTAVTHHKIGLVVNLATAISEPSPTSSSDCTALLPNTVAISITMLNRVCNVEVIAINSSVRENTGRAADRPPLPRFEVAYQRWPQYELKPSLELWSSLAASGNQARIVVLSNPGDIPWMAHTIRFAAKHVLSLAWATRSGAVIGHPNQPNVEVGGL
jgi:hypothetical protein